jgi:WD40 repeat protein
MQWTGRNLTKSDKKHTDALWAIKSIKNDSMLMTGGNDGIIYFWDKLSKQSIDLTPLSKFPWEFVPLTI